VVVELAHRFSSLLLVVLLMIVLLMAAGRPGSGGRSG
jgi:hypothetical protein